MESQPIKISKKKTVYPVSEPLRRYLLRYGREKALPLHYPDLLNYQESVPLTDRDGRDTLWETAIYPSYAIDTIHGGLKKLYALLKAGGDFAVQQHLFIDRIDYCTFGNSHPFRIRIVNRYNDVYDYFYLKVADANRIYGLELEHVLSPNQMVYLVAGDTLVEEHIAGIPGDTFIRLHLNRPEYNPRRIAKEFVKFNERCHVRLLGDMRAYNFVMDVTPDFDDFQFRIRPIDFDQELYEGQARVYKPQYFKENFPYVEFALKHFNVQVMRQYQQEERAAIVQRIISERVRLGHLRNAMRADALSTPEKIAQLRTELAVEHSDPHFETCQSMADIIEWSLKRLFGSPMSPPAP